MPTYYRGPRIVITDSVYAIRGPIPQQFAISELRNIRIECGERASLWPGVAATAAGALVVAVAVLLALPGPGSYVAALALVVTPLVTGVAWQRLTPPGYELWATYHGVEVRLFDDTDLTTFGQVKRGLVRALEAHRDRFDATQASRRAAS